MGLAAHSTMTSIVIRCVTNGCVTNGRIPDEIAFILDLVRQACNSCLNLFISTCIKLLRQYYHINDSFYINKRFATFH